MGLAELSHRYASNASLKAFETYFAANGFNCFDYGTLPEALRGLYLVPQEVGYEMLKSFCLKAGREKFLDKCVVDYLANPQFQAYAASSRGAHFIGISAALPALLQALFQNLFTFTNPFSPGWEEAEDADEIAYDFPDKLMRGRFRPEHLYPEVTALVSDTVPLEKWQRKMAVKLAELAIVFCVGHEIGHVVRGHTVLAKRRRLFAVAEVDEPGSQSKRRPLGKWLSQSWELQADQTAIALLYSYVVRTAKNRRKFMHYLKCDNDLDLCGRILYAVYFVFLLLGQQQYSVRSSVSHPAAITRITYIMAFLGTVLVDVAGFPVQTAGEAMEKYAGLAVDAWRRIGFSDGRYEDIEENLSGVIQDLGRANRLAGELFRKYQWAFKP